MASGRKPRSPKVRDLSDGTLKVIEGGRSVIAHAEAPDWITDARARALWAELRVELIRLHRWSPLFDQELGRYCVAFGQYCWALAKLEDPEASVAKTPNGMLQLSAYQVILNRAHDTMRHLAGDLGLNPAEYHRLDGLQLDLFDQPAARGEGSGFARFRR